MKTRLTELLGVEYPIIQGGMRWVARAELVAAVGNAGGFGFLSAHTQLSADDLRREIHKVRELSDKPFGVNLTVLPSNTGIDYDAYVKVIIDEAVTAVETAGSNPAKYIAAFKEGGVKVMHKCTTVRHAVKAESLGADSVSIDGFECAGHPGRDDVPGLILIPTAADALSIPVAACGGFSDGRSLITALALGAEGINMGTRFMLTRESPVHERVKAGMVAASERDTALVGRSIGDPVRVWRNKLVDEALQLEAEGKFSSHSDLDPYIGAQRWMDAMESGDVDDAAFPLGIVAGRISDLPSCAQLIDSIVSEAREIVAGRLGGIFA